MDDSLVKAIADNPIVIFSGAGISFDAPTSLPLGLELVGWFTKKLFLPSQEKLISGARLRPEVIMQILWEFTGISVFQSLSSFSKRPPNRYHIFLNELIKIKKIESIFTTNLDTSHEMAQDFLGEIFITHLHGRADDSESIMYALDQVSNKKSRGLINQLKTIPSGATVIFLGYSGCDDFDIAPALRGLPDDIKFIWINHTNGIKKWEISTPEKHSPIYSILKSRTANNAIYICGHTWYFCHFISSILDIEKKYHEISLKYDPTKYNQSKIKNEVQNETVSNLKKIKKEISALMSAEILYRFIDNPPKAIKICKKINLSNLNKSEINGYYRTLGYAQYRCGNYTDSEDSFRKAMKFGVRKSLIKKCLADIFYRKNQFTEAKRMIKEAIRDATKTPKHNLDIGKALFSWALILQETGEREKALSIYKRAIRIFKIEGDVYSLGNVYNNKGTIFQDSNLLDKAKFEFNRSLKLRELINHNEGICYSLLNIGLVYRSKYCISQKKKFIKKALEYIYKAFSTQADLAFSYNKGLILKNLGDVFLDYYDFQKAELNLSKAYDLYKRLQGMEGGLFSCLLSLFELYLIQNNRIKALGVSKKLRELINHDQLIEKTIWYKTLIQGASIGFETNNIEIDSYHPTYLFRYKQLCSLCHIRIKTVY